MPSTDLAPPLCRQTVPTCQPVGPSQTPESLGNSDQAPRSMFGVSEKCWEGRQEDNAVAEVGFCFADVDALNKPSGVC